MDVVVFGCGLAGKAIVRDLADTTNHRLTVVDSDEAALAEATDGMSVRTVVADLTQAGAAAEVAKGQDLALGATPGRLGMQVIREALEAGCQVVDISFMPEDPFGLDELAREKGLAALVDCGVAPGTSNLLVGRAAAELDMVEDVSILVGGLPLIRRLPYEYSAVYSPADVLEQYTRPATIIENGEEVSRPALTEQELVEVPGVGTLEAFLTDGLRTLRRTIAAPNMREKTLRYPGHCDRIRLLVDTGLLSEEPVVVGSAEVKPRDVTAQLLQQIWEFRSGDEDMTVLHVEVTGRKGDEQLRYEYDLMDVFDTAKGITSMARTTGYAATGMVKLLAQGKIKDIGVIPPERVGALGEVCDEMLVHLAERGIHVSETVETGA